MAGGCLDERRVASSPSSYSRAQSGRTFPLASSVACERGTGYGKQRFLQVLPVRIARHHLVRICCATPAASGATCVNMLCTPRLPERSLIFVAVPC